MSIFRKWSKPRFLLVYLLVPVLFLIASTTERQLRLGMALALLGVSIRFWANGYAGHVKVNWTQKWRGDAKIGQLITAGPYAHVRHPLYFGSLLIGVGILTVVGHLWFAVVAIGLLFLVYRWKLLREEAILLEEWGEAYHRYQAQVPRYLPMWRRYDTPHGRWSWQGIRASKEWKTLIWVLVILIALYLREEALQEHDLLSVKERVKHALVLAVAVMLMLTDGVVELAYRWKRQALTFSRADHAT